MENKYKQISAGLNKVSQEYIEFRKKMDPICMSEVSKRIEKIEKPLRSPKLGGLLFPLRKKQTIERYSYDQNLIKFWNEEYVLIHEINEKTNKDGISQREIGELENKLIDFDKKWNSPKSFRSDWVYELGFQFPEFVDNKLKNGYLNVPSENIASFNNNALNDFINNLTKYAKQYEKQVKDLIKKTAEVYKIDSERGIKGKRLVGGCSMGLGGLSWSTASECLGLMRQLGNALGWSEEEIYSFVGIPKEEIEKNEKAWSKKYQGY
jgi:hypothetical protein